ncbi:WD repeat-containing protein 78 [Kappamyces sp. JEL0829]|nr:WD repeat-containing protein 78 [Kappamyces sp. JEL0829]
MKSGETLRNKANVDGKRSERYVNITNSNGEDVTPQSLSSYRQATKTADGSNSAIDISAAKETVSDLLNHLEMLSGTAHEGSSKSIAYTGSHLSVSGHESIGESDRGSESGSAYGDPDDGGDSTTQLAHKLNVESTVQLPSLLQQKPKETDPTKVISISLTETDTMFLLTIPSTSVSSEAIEEATFVKAQNAKYKELKSIIPNNDNYVSRAMQTLQEPTKTKEVQATGNKYVNAEVNVSQWAIYDAFHEMEQAVNQDAVEGKKEFVDLETKLYVGSTDTARMSVSQGSNVDSGLSRRSSILLGSSAALHTASMEGSRSSISASSTGIAKAAAAAATTAVKEDPLVLINQDSLMDTLSLMERAIIGNNYHKKILSYRNVQDDGLIEHKRVAAILQQGIETDENDDAQLDFDEKEQHREDDTETVVPRLKFLWFFRCELTKGRQVLDMSWNKQNEDILAVSYGESKTLLHSSTGLILVWSAKNPEWPDRIYESSSPVTSVDFSKSNPGLLAAGFMDGRVVIYDVRKNDTKWIMNGGDTAGKHRDPVWELKWVERERVVGDEQSRGETLISVSTDGRVTQWMIRKGLEYTDLMVLKRVTKQKANAGKANEKSNSFIARQTGGLCFDFNAKDSNVYLVGTEDGQIHKCSSSYNEQYLNTFSTHTGPINKVKWSPFLSNAFLSCSADWTVRLWNHELEDEVFKFQSGKDTVNDIAWSPHNSTMFGTVSSNGRLEIWDLRYSVLDPVINHSVLDRQLTAMCFASQGPIVVTGDDYGAVSVFKICKNGGGYMTSKEEEQDTADGIMNENAKLLPSESSFHAWRQEEAKGLADVIGAKLNGIVQSTAPVA